MSPAARNRSARPSRIKRSRGTRKKRSSGLLGRLVRWALGSLLLTVLLLYLASLFGFLDVGRRSTGEQRIMAARDWELPNHRLVVEASGPAGWGAEREGGFLEKVSRWASEAFPPQHAAPPAPAGGAWDMPGSLTGADPQERPIRVYLANGCGADRLAASLRPILQAAGFDVCGVDNADRCDYSETLIVDRCGERRKADEICRFFQKRWGVGRVLLQARRSRETDVLIVLGRDLAERLGWETPG